MFVFDDEEVRMAQTKRVGSLELEQDLAFQRKDWRVQRVAWVVGLILLLLAAAGVFGSGPAAHAELAAAGDLVHARYDRFVRREAPASLELRLRADTGGPDTVQVWLGNEFFERVEIRGIQPEPSNVRLLDDGALYEFAGPASGDEVNVTIHYRPQHTGTMATGIGAEAGASDELRQFVYP
jgi:hypothetical protein